MGLNLKKLLKKIIKAPLVKQIAEAIVEKKLNK